MLFNCNNSAHTATHTDALCLGCRYKLVINNTTDDNNNIWNYTSYLPTNKLCYPSIWSQMKGKWNWDNNLNWTSNYNYNSNLDIYNDNCTVINDELSGAGDIIWIGSRDGQIPNANYEYKYFVFRVNLLLISSQHYGHAGMLFRALNVSDVNNGGDQYYYGVQCNSGNAIYLAKMNDNWEIVLIDETIIIDCNVIHSLTIVGNDINFDFYLNESYFGQILH